VLLLPSLARLERGDIRDGGSLEERHDLLPLRSPELVRRTRANIFGRLRPLHTNAAIFAFAGQRDVRGHLPFDAAAVQGADVQRRLCRFHFWGWQLIIVAAALTLPLGFHAAARSTPNWSGRSTSRSRWSGWLFAINFFGTLVRRRERHMYVALVVLHRDHRHHRRVAHLQQPGGAGRSLLKSYSVYAGVQDAFMQWWYGHNAVGVFC
jgi:cytochrome c oxidase cbb3-type subunit I/II